jgi:hypothetical protein
MISRTRTSHSMLNDKNSVDLSYFQPKITKKLILTVHPRYYGSQIPFRILQGLGTLDISSFS